MTKPAVNKIMEGLEDARAFAKGDTSRAIVHTVTVPTVDVRAILGDPISPRSATDSREGSMVLPKENRVARRR